MTQCLETRKITAMGWETEEVDGLNGDSTLMGEVGDVWRGSWVRQDSRWCQGNIIQLHQWSRELLGIRMVSRNNCSTFVKQVE